VVPPEFAPIVVVPAAMQSAKPATLGALAMVATGADDELQWLFSVMSCVLPSLNVPVATNCCVLPAAAVGAAGVSASETSVPVPTVRLVLPVMPDADAEITTVPLFFPWAMPVERIEATFGFDDFQEMPARFEATLPSLNVPVAVYFSDVPLSILAPAGFTVMDTKWAVDTVSVVEPLTEPDPALIVAVPVATLVARPWPLMVATAAEEDVQSTVPVMSCVLESLNVPVAENCFVVPTAMLELAGVTAIDTSVALVTVSEAVPLTDPDVAVIVAVPALMPAASPPELMLATELDDELHVTEVNSCVLPSSKLPIALNCCCVATAIEFAAGLTEIEVK
jgi:hypothetical protein